MRIKTAIASVTSGLVIGLMYFLSPLYGSEYNKNPDKVLYSLSEEQIKHTGSESKFTWQWNLDRNINPEPKFEDYLMPISLCNKVTEKHTTNGQLYGKTSNKTMINGLIATGVKGATDYTKVPIKQAWNPLQSIPSCNIDPEHKVVNAIVEVQARASDDNFDLGSESIFRKDKPNQETAQSRDIKISKAIEGLTTYNSDVVKVIKLDPEEVQFRQEYINQLLEKQFPMGTKLERLEILSKINQSDKQVIKDPNLENLIAQHRGMSVSTTKFVETQQVLTIPAPVGMSPMLLLVPSVRIASFQAVRVVFTSGLFVFNRLTFLGLHLLRQFAQLSIYSLRLLRIALRKLIRKAKKDTYNSGVWAVDSYQDCLTNLAQKIRESRVQTYLLNRQTRNINKFTESKLQDIYANSALILSLTDRFGNTNSQFSTAFVKTFTLYLLDCSVKLAEDVHKELMSLMLAEYVNSNVNVQSLDEVVKSFLVTSTWQYHGSSRMWIDKSKDTIYSLIQFQKHFNHSIGEVTQQLIRATLHALIGLVEAFEIVIKKFKELNQTKTAITHEIPSEFDVENISSVMLSKIMEDLNSGQREQLYQFSHNEQKIVMHVNYHPEESLVGFDNQPVDGMLSLNTENFTVFSNDKITIRAKILD
jgi:hypothetical protein